ncbi:MAG: hypothetical protein LBK12_05100 [Odoribacteraceae bacterium]|jgi:hypothetical protein|nr:hypothetical protein [Odoribacteraceae bacterium]
MRKIIIMLAALLWGAGALHAQDIITLKNGDEIKAKVQEVGLADVKYKKFENLTGPTYTLMKTEIFMIKYENGEKDIFKDAPATTTTTTTSDATTATSPQQPQEDLYFSNGKFRTANGRVMTSEQMRTMLAEVPEALKLYESGERKNTTTWIFMIPAASCTLLALLNMNKDPGIAWGTMGVGVGFTVGAVVFVSSSVKKFESAYKTYQNAKANPTTSLSFGITRSGGVGLTLTF